MRTNSTQELLKYQSYLNTDLLELVNADEDQVKYVGKTHYGDAIVEEAKNEDIHLNLYRSLDVNIPYSDALIIIESRNAATNWEWEILLEYDA